MKNDKMPVIFIGHGSPENALGNNEFTENWKKIAKKIPRPKVILCVSAHWLTKQVEINSSDEPKIIYDFYGFADELYKIKYNCKGLSETAKLIKEKLKGFDAKLTEDWGIDHGAWIVLKNMYPKADIPVIQLSINFYSPLQKHFDIGRKLKELREEGVLIIGSGNIVHNLRVLDWSENPKPYSWAIEFDNFVKENIENKNYDNLINYKMNKYSSLAHPTNDHYLPLLYVLGACEGEEGQFFNEKVIMGSLSMRCVAFGLDSFT